MNISWFNRDKKSGVATIYPTNITINKVISDTISDAYGVLLGIDEKEKLVVLKPVSINKYDEGTIDKNMFFKLSGGKTYSRVSSTDFVNEISSVFALDFSVSPKKFTCIWDKEEKVVIINLSKEIR
ncbi:MAG: hypothetical protein PHW22_02350 [Bacilli bacterium]|nr:hypothetical protein [Bacilli bacterium]